MYCNFLTRFLRLLLIILPFIFAFYNVSYFLLRQWLAAFIRAFDWSVAWVTLSGSQHVYVRADVTVLAVPNARGCSGRPLPWQQRHDMQWRDDDVTVLAGADQLTSFLTLVVTSSMPSSGQLSMSVPLLQLIAVVKALRACCLLKTKIKFYKYVHWVPTPA